MAGVPVRGNAKAQARSFTPISTGATVVQCHDDARTAQSAGELLQPASISSTLLRWVKRGADITRVVVFAAQPVGATVTTSPIVRVIGAFGVDGSEVSPSNDGTFSNTGSVRFVRLDNAQASAAGMTLTLSSSGANLMRDASRAYTNPAPDLDGIDLRGCDWFAVLVQTAAAYSAGGGETPVFALGLN